MSLETKRQPCHLTVGCQILKNGFLFKTLTPGDYRLTYPIKIFKKFPDRAKRFLADNFCYARSQALALSGYRLSYQTARPALKAFIDQGIINDLPCIADINGQPIKKLVNDFKNSAGSKTVFLNDDSPRQLPGFKALENNFILALSFGKDS